MRINICSLITRFEKDLKLKKRSNRHNVQGNINSNRYIGSPGKFVPITILIRYTFIELYGCHFIPRPFSIFHTTCIFHPSRTSKVSKRQTF